MNEMGRISRENIEEFILDYLEGNLDKDTHEEVKRFILLNPDIEEDVYGLDLTYLEKKEIVFPDKAQLKASESINEFEEKCILAIERQLEPTARASFEKEVASDNTKKEILDSYSKTIIHPDEYLVFSEKDSLRHTISFRFRRIIHYSSAAAIILLLSVSSLLINKTDITNRNYINKITPLSSNLNNELIIEVPKQEPLKNISLIKKQIARNTKSQVVKNDNNDFSKVSVIDIKKAKETLLAKSFIDGPEPNEIIIPDERYILASERDFCLNENAMKWSERKNRRKKAKNTNLNKFLKYGESTLRSFVNQFVSTTKISHEKIIYVADSKMD